MALISLPLMSAGQISEFKVMIRPLQAVQIIHEQMQKMLTQFKNNEQI